MLASSLAPYAEVPVDIDRLIRMLLVHDIGEIDADDTMVFVEGGWEERKSTELTAVTRIFGLFPAAQGAELLSLWKEFEHGETVDVRFANAADRAMPVLLNLANAGQNWRENGISYERVMGRVAPPTKAGCPALWDYLQSRLEVARDRVVRGLKPACSRCKRRLQQECSNLLQSSTAVPAQKANALS